MLAYFIIAFLFGGGFGLLALIVHEDNDRCHYYNGMWNIGDLVRGCLAMGNDTTALWLGDMRIEVGCDKAIQLLSALEMYALECFNVTAAHKKAVSALGSVEDVEAFDVTEGYPVRLSMTV